MSSPKTGKDAASAPSAAASKSQGTNSVTQNAILTETVRKEMRQFRLHSTYSVTPSIRKNLVLTVKPNNTNPTVLETDCETAKDAEYISVAKKMQQLPREKYGSPQTSNQEYFWDTKQLLDDALTNHLSHRPKRTTEITRLFRAPEESDKKKENAKKR